MVWLGVGGGAGNQTQGLTYAKQAVLPQRYAPALWYDFYHSLFNHFHIGQYLGHLQPLDILNDIAIDTFEQAPQLNNFPS